MCIIMTFRSFNRHMTSQRLIKYDNILICYLIAQLPWYTITIKVHGLQACNSKIFIIIIILLTSIYVSHSGFPI